MGNPREVEVKLRLDPDNAPLLARSGFFAGVDPEEHHFHTVYFDDEKRHLLREGFELRVRQDGERSLQTLKTIDSVERGEWETEAEEGGPSLEDIEAPGLSKLQKRGIDLRPQFSLEVERRTWSVTRDGSCIEVALDDGTLEAQGRQTRICEAELELKSGDSIALYELAQKIGEEAAATPYFVSKGARGYRLAEDAMDTPARGLTLRFEHNVSVADAFQKIADACLRQFSLSEEILGKATDAEAIHQARVAIRRLRAAFSMFKDVVVGEDADAARSELKWLSDLFGKVRDLDVFADSRMSRIALQHPDVPGMQELTQELEAMRERSRRRLQDALHSPRFRVLLLNVARCVHSGQWRQSDGGRFLDFARSELDRRLRSVIKKRKAVRGVDARKRHRLRIKAKKLRYMFEFMRPAAASCKALGVETDRLERLQDLLGELNDAIAGERLLGRVVKEAQAPAVNYAADLVRATLTVSPNLAQKAIKTHADLRRTQPFDRG
jgi:triphosphatase